MSDSNITKLALANSLKELMTNKAFSKICVHDIVENCGLTRQAFYYHFKDKYDLMNWIYYTEIVQFMSAYDKVEHWADGLKDLCCYMQQHKTFYINALNTTGQNSFQEYLHGYLCDISLSVMENSKNTKFEEKKRKFIAEFTADTFVGLIVRWADNGMKEDPADYFAQIRGIFDGSILQELEDETKSWPEKEPVIT